MIAHAMACTDIVLKCVTIEFLSVHVITPCPKCDLHLSVSRVNHLFTLFLTGTGNCCQMVSGSDLKYAIET